MEKEKTAYGHQDSFYSLMVEIEKFGAKWSYRVRDASSVVQVKLQEAWSAFERLKELKE